MSAIEIWLNIFQAVADGVWMLNVKNQAAAQYLCEAKSHRLLIWAWDIVAWETGSKSLISPWRK